MKSTKQLYIAYALFFLSLVSYADIIYETPLDSYTDDVIGSHGEAVIKEPLLKEFRLSSEMNGFLAKFGYKPSANKNRWRAETWIYGNGSRTQNVYFYRENKLLAEFSWPEDQGRLYSNRLNNGPLIVGYMDDTGYITDLCVGSKTGECTLYIDASGSISKLVVH